MTIGGDGALRSAAGAGEGAAIFCLPIVRAGSFVAQVPFLRTQPPRRLRRCLNMTLPTGLPPTAEATAVMRTRSLWCAFTAARTLTAVTTLGILTDRLVTEADADPV